MSKLCLSVLSGFVISCVPVVAAGPGRGAYAERKPDAMWTYREVAGKALQLSVFLPAKYAEGRQFPAFVVFHGGSWTAGEASWHYPDCAYWSDRGMIAVSVDYRLRKRDNVQVPLECVKDAKSSIRFLRKNAAKLKVDPDRIVAAGGSAGGQLAAATAMIATPDTNDDQCDLSISCVPNAVICYNPWYRCAPALSPPKHVRAGLPPLISFLGDKDPTPVKDLVSFHDALVAAGNASELYIGHGAGHGFCNGRNPRNPFFYWSLELTDRFLVKHGILTGKQSIQRPSGLPQVTSDAYVAPYNYDGIATGKVLAEIRSTRVSNGIVILVGAADTTYDEADKSGFTVVGLETDRERVERIRRRVQNRDSYGRVSASLFDGSTIPCVNGLVNVVVVEQDGLGDTEITRVLVPGGMSLVLKNGEWQKRGKPWPVDMDEWNQYLRSADNNAVSRDKVGPPQRLKWTGGTRWGRSHMSAVTVVSMVSAAGRLYTIEDLETVEHSRLPGKYSLLARDAFNGMELWKQPLAGNWTSQGYLKFISTQYQRRIAAIGDRVYCPLGMGEPISVLDGATGQVLRDYPATARVQEFVHDRDMIYAAVGEPFGMKASKDAQVKLLAVGVSAGQPLWERQISDDGGYMGGTLAAKDNVLVYCTRTSIRCAEIGTGEDRWQIRHEALIPKRKKSVGVWLGNAVNNLQPTLVLSDDMLYCSTLYAVTAYRLSDGARVWAADNVPNYGKPSDIFLAAGLVWTGLMTGHDLETGKVVRTLEQQMKGPMSHDRCYRNRITDTYLINSKSGGADFLRLDGKGEFPAPWVRATCGLGVVPANGLLYSSPYSCTCEIGIMLTSFNALYDESRSRGKTPDLDATPRLIKGPAYVRPADAANATEDDWPTYRKTNSRSGATASEYDGELNVTWQTKLSTTPTAPVVVGDRVFVAARDSHILYGLSRKTGKISWTFTADGRIDSPPTYYRGLLLFGSRAGWVYAVNANDGTLAWKFMDLPEKRLISARGQLESAWPVNGSVMVHANLAYFAAGRQSFIDGGVVVYALNPLTGKVLHRRRMYGPVDDKGFHIPRKAGFRSEGFKSGIFSSEHDLLFIRHQAFKPDLTPVPLDDITSTHLLASPGFLDDTPQHRTYWSIDTDLHYGPGNGKPGAGPQGDILCFEGDVFYDVRGYLPGRHSTTFKPQKGCTLFSGERAKGEKPRNSELFPKKGQWKERWAKQIPMAGHALILAGDTVVVAGVPLESSYSNTDFSSSFAGNKGGVIWTVAKGDGARIASLKLPSPPVWDGLASAGGQCFVATQDGTVVCFGDGNLESKQKDWKK